MFSDAQVLKFKTEENYRNIKDLQAWKSIIGVPEARQPYIPCE